MRVGADGRFGLRLVDPQSGIREPALAYEELAAEQQQRERDEERRLFYVAMTRARERLILSGAAKFESPSAGNGGAPISWIAPALVPDIAERVAQGKWGEAEGVQVALAAPGQSTPAGAGAAAATASDPVVLPAPPRPQRRRPVSRLSYSALAAYQKCSYRFYVERVLGVPPNPVEGEGEGEGPAALGGIERGVLAHAALERLDFRRGVPVRVADLVLPRQRRPSSEEAAELDRLLQRFAASELCQRVGRATHVKREQAFSFLLGEVLIGGTFDVLAQEQPGMLLVLDYKTDRLQGAKPLTVFERYAAQRLIYALAALRSGAAQVEVIHVFLEAPEEPLAATFGRGDVARLQERLQALAAGASAGMYRPTEEPHRRVCAGCPAEGGLCSWPVSMTRRQTVAQLF